MKGKNKTGNTEKSITIDMPEVKDIPGQEHIKPPRIREMADSTPSSDSDEGKGLLDDLNKEFVEDETIVSQASSTDVTKEEIELLKKSERISTDETKDLERLELDEDDGEDLLNEGSNPMDMGEDLDVPGSELDDDNEELGEEDEENNPYSTRDD